MSLDLTHPHDRFVKAILSNIKVAQGLLQANLPQELQEKIDWSSLALTNKSFVNKQLEEFHSDLIYHCQLDNQPAYLYLHLEHQKKPDKLLPFRLLEYNVLLMRQHLDEGNEKLPTIINLCLYAGDEKPYPYSCDLYELFQDKELAQTYFLKPAQLIDLTVKTEEEIKTYGEADIMGLLLKQAVQRNF